jgi:hypothetical protein
MNKLAILKMSKKKIIGAVCAIALFAGGAVVGAQIYANASSNAVAVLPIAKGGTGASSLSTAISSSSTDSQVPTAKSVYTILNTPTKYYHQVRVYQSTYEVYVSWIDSSSTAITSKAALITAIYNANGTREILATGYSGGSDDVTLMALIASSATEIKMVGIDSTFTKKSFVWGAAASSVTDKVVPLAA